jgi:hypothetical protein
MNDDEIQKCLNQDRCDALARAVMTDQTYHDMAIQYQKERAMYYDKYCAAMDKINTLKIEIEKAYEKGFIDGAQKTMESRVTKFLDREKCEP